MKTHSVVAFCFTITISLLFGIFILNDAGFMQALAVAGTLTAGIFSNFLKDIIKEQFEGRIIGGKRVLSYEGYGEKSIVLFIYSVLFTMALIIIFSIFPQEAYPNKEFGEDLTVFSGSLILFSGIPLLILMGRYIGIRYRKEGWMLPLYTALTSRLIISILEFVGLDSVNSNNILYLVATFTIGVVAIGASTYLGFWIGRRRRNASYVNYLMLKLTDEERATLIDLVKDTIRDSKGSRK